MYSNEVSNWVEKIKLRYCDAPEDYMCLLVCNNGWWCKYKKENKMKDKDFAQVKVSDLKKAYEEGCDDVKATLKRMYPDFFDCHPEDEPLRGIGVRICEDGSGYILRITHHGEDIGFVADGKVRPYSYKKSKSGYEFEHDAPGPVMTFRAYKRK